jgi:hypothetical protein
MGVKETVNSLKPPNGSQYIAFWCLCSEILNCSLSELQASHSSASCVVKESVCPEFLPASVFTVWLSVCLGHVKTVYVCEFWGRYSGVDEDFVFWHKTLRHEWAVHNITTEPGFCYLVRPLDLWVLLLLLLLLLLLFVLSSLVTGLFFPVLHLNQQRSPPLRLQASHCSTFRITCDVPIIAVSVVNQAVHMDREVTGNRSDIII